MRVSSIWPGTVHERVEGGVLSIRRLATGGGQEGRVPPVGVRVAEGSTSGGTCGCDATILREGLVA